MNKRAGRPSDTGYAPSPDRLTAREAAAQTGISARAIRRAISRGELAATKHAGRYLIAEAEVERYRRAGAGAVHMRRPVFILPLAAAPQPKPLIQLVPPVVQPPSLPEALTSLIGREATVAAVAGLLDQDDARLLVLTGPGGVGKTRIALQVARALRPSFADGVAFVALAPIGDPTQVPSAIAQVLGVKEGDSHPVADRLIAFLREKRLLLVLDNFEQVTAAGQVVTALLEGCGGLKVLVTSRSRLRVRGERTFAVPPLTVLAGDRPDAPGEPAEATAVRLFVARAGEVAADFTLTPANAATITEICHRLDGLPLAIELAAARVRHLPPAAILGRLRQHLPVLTGGPTDGPDRQRTMRDAIAWSYALLSPDEQGAFRRLAVFVGGWTLEAAAAVIGHAATRHRDPLDTVSSLVDHSLIEPTERGDGEPRYRMLETIREFGLEQLAASGERDLIRRRHVDWCLGLAEQAAPDLYGGARQAAWLGRLEAEHENLRAALAWLAEAGDADGELRLAGAVFWFWYIRGYFAEGRRWLERALTRGITAPAAVRARALLGLGMLAQRQGDDESARRLLDEALGLAREAGHVTGIALALGLMAVTEEDAGRHEQATALWHEALAVPWTEEPERGPLEALTIAHLGVSAWGQGDYDRAAGYWETALDLHRALADAWGVANTQAYLAIAACDRGDLPRAAALQRESLRVFWEANSVEDTATCLANTAAISAARGDFTTAARLFGAAEARWEEIGSRPRLPEVTVYDRARAAVRAALPAPEVTAAWMAGRALAPAAAVTEALAALDAPERRRLTGPEAAGAGLTPREWEVLRLLVAGRSDKEIGDALFISRRTAMTHVSHLLAKLGVASRGAAAALAVRERLV